MVTGSPETFLYSIVIFPALGVYFMVAPSCVAIEYLTPSLTSVASTQLVLHGLACTARHPISVGWVASTVIVRALPGGRAMLDSIGMCSTAAWAMPVHGTERMRIERRKFFTRTLAMCVPTFGAVEARVKGGLVRGEVREYVSR